MQPSKRGSSTRLDLDLELRRDLSQASSINPSQLMNQLSADASPPLRVTAVVSAAAQPLAPQSAAPHSEATAEEHAVSMLSHGPCSPDAKESRPAAIETAPPVAGHTLTLAESSAA